MHEFFSVVIAFCKIIPDYFILNFLFWLELLDFWNVWIIIFIDLVALIQICYKTFPYLKNLFVFFWLLDKALPIFMVTNHCLSLTYQRCLILFSPILLKIFCIICWLVIFLFVHSVKFTHRYTSADHHHDLSHVLKSLQLFHNDSLILFILLFSFISFSILTSKFLNYYLTSLDCDEICIIFTIFNV